MTDEIATFEEQIGTPDLLLRFNFLGGVGIPDAAMDDWQEVT